MKLTVRSIGAGFLLLVILSFMILMIWGLLNKTSTTGKSGSTRLEKAAPEFTLSLLNGEDLVLADHIGKPIVINFWASWCPPCREEAKILEKVWRTYKAKDVLFIGIGIQDSTEDAESYLKLFDISYPNGLDHDGRITVDYGVIGLPVTFLINETGVVETRWVGAITESQLVSWLE
jgi:cytochrome c biogenesis protein CcmG/thiol:disulfide interchange protein DsbE